MPFNEFNRSEVDSQYVTADERFVVSLVVGYDGDTVTTPEEAAQAAIALTRDGGSGDTVWFVYDRKTNQMHRFEQEDFEEER